MGKTMIKSYGLLWLACLQAALAQQCNRDANWWVPLHNTHLEDPCAMALVVRSYCGLTDPFTANTQQIPRPSTGCLCNALTYVLYSACFECQSMATPLQDRFPGESYPSWSAGCSQSMIPPDKVDVPDWAHRMISFVQSRSVSFSITQALIMAEEDPITTTVSPSSTKPPEPASASVISSVNAGPGVPSSTGSSSPATTQVAEPSASPNKSKIGPIVGGVIGGVVVLALIFGLLFFCRRKRNRKVAPSSEFAKYHKGPSLVAPHSPTSPEPPQFSAGPGPAYSPVRQASGYESGVDEELPGFTPGTYAGPVYEKPGQYIADPNLPPGSSSSHAATRPAL